MPQIRERERLRVAHGGRLGPMQAAREHRRDVRLGLHQRLCIQCAKGDAEIALPALCLGQTRVEFLCSTVQADPSGPPQQTCCARLCGKRIVLGYAMLDQARVVAGDLGMPLPCRMPPPPPKERRDVRQRREVVVGIDRAVQPIAQERRQVARESMRGDRLTLDDAGIAERSLLGDAAPIDQHHGTTALLQVQGDADADHAGAEDRDVRLHRSRRGLVAQGKMACPFRINSTPASSPPPANPRGPCPQAINCSHPRLTSVCTASSAHARCTWCRTCRSR